MSSTTAPRGREHRFERFRSEVFHSETDLYRNPRTSTCEKSGNPTEAELGSLRERMIQLIFGTARTRKSSFQNCWPHENIFKNLSALNPQVLGLFRPFRGQNM